MDQYVPHTSDISPWDIWKLLTELRRDMLNCLSYDFNCSYDRKNGFLVIDKLFVCHA